MDKEEARRAYERFHQLREQSTRTVKEEYEMDRLLHQVGLFLALEQGKTRHQYADEQRASREGWAKAKTLGVSERASILAGVVAYASESGRTESEFLDVFRKYYPGWVNEEEIAELQQANLWPW